MVDEIQNPFPGPLIIFHDQVLPERATPAGSLP
jgi:hypothetical protein